MGRRRVILFCDSPLSGGFEQLMGRLATSLAELPLDVGFWFRGARAARFRAVRPLQTRWGSLLRMFFPTTIERIAKRQRE